MTDVILYIETNFLLSHALGRDDSTDEILFDSRLQTRLVLPSVCIVESMITFEGARKRHNALIVELERQARESKRNKVSARIDPLVNHLEQSVIELGGIFNESKTRLVAAIEQLGTSAEFIDLNATILDESLNRPLLDEPTDSLILASILNHARSVGPIAKTFLSENRRDFAERAYPKGALQSAGIKYFELASKFLGWRRSQTEP